MELTIVSLRQKQFSFSYQDLLLINIPTVEKTDFIRFLLRDGQLGSWQTRDKLASENPWYQVFKIWDCVCDKPINWSYNWVHKIRLFPLNGSSCKRKRKHQLLQRILGNILTEFYWVSIGWDSKVKILVLRKGFLWSLRREFVKRESC